MKQDQRLKVISEGLDTLKNMAHDLNEEMDRQVPLMDGLTLRVDNAASDYFTLMFTQDQGLEVISEGLDKLKDMARDLNEEIDRQVPLMDGLTLRVDNAASDLKNTNVRLKDTVNQTERIGGYGKQHGERFRMTMKDGWGEEEYKRQVEKLKEEVMCMFMEAVDLAAKLEFIDNIEKLGLANLFEMEIKEALDTIVAFKNNHPITEEGLYANALFFRLLRQHGFNISQDIFRGFTSKMGTFIKTTNCDTKAMLELLEASHLALEGENILIEAKAFSTGILKNITNSKNVENKVTKQLSHALELPLQWRVQWYDVKSHIHELENNDNTNSVLLKLAKLNFNMVQATHQNDLKEISRWDDKEIQRLPECMKICFQAFYNTTNEVAHEIQKEKGWKNSILPYLHKV
ncbi:unnamed protein product [Camellia sinensis]